MRIFYAVMRSPNLSALGASNLWYRNLYHGLAALGHEIVEFDFDMGPLLLHADIRQAENRRFVERERPRLEEALVCQVREAHRARGCDLFFSYFYDACASPASIGQIRALGIPTVNFYCNAVHQFDLVRDLAPAFDICMVPERVALPSYERVGARAVHIQMAADPETYRPYDLPRVFDATFVGQKYGERSKIIEGLRRHGVDVRVWGPGWQPATSDGNQSRGDRRVAVRVARLARRFLVSPSAAIRSIGERLADRRRIRSLAAIAGPPLPDEEVVRMYSRSRVSLGFSTVSDPVPSGQPNAHMRLRDFEATMSGACYVTGYVDEVPLYFEPDKEIVTYRDFDELVAKVRHLLAHPETVESIRQAARQRALTDHTWEQRFVQLFRVMGLPARADTTN